MTARLRAAMAAALMGVALCPVLAQGAQWVRVGSGGGSESYIDKSSILRVDKNYKVWSLVSYAGEQMTQDGTTYRSMKALHVYSCAERTTTLQSQVYYSEAMGKGPVVQSLKYERFNPEDIVPDSVADGALQMICKRPVRKK